jgi:hypothetical protein
VSLVVLYLSAAEVKDAVSGFQPVDGQLGDAAMRLILSFAETRPDLSAVNSRNVLVLSAWNEGRTMPGRGGR